MSILEHLAELRSRLLRVCMVLLVCILCSYVFRQELLDTFKAPVMEPLRKYAALRKDVEVAPPPIESSKAEPLKAGYACNCEAKPAPEVPDTQPPAPPELLCHCTPTTEGNLTSVAENEQGSLVFLALPELFFSQLKVAFFAGLFLAFPYLLVELWGFVGPALYKNEKKVFWSFAGLTYICFIGGALFGYFVVFPFGFEFFLSLTQPGEIVPSLSIGAYLSFAVKLLFAFGIVFELPMAILILSRLGLITPSWMIRHSKYAILLFFAVAAILTPPDPFTMILMAGPLIALYYFSVLVCYFTVNRAKAAERSLSMRQ